MCIKAIIAGVVLMIVGCVLRSAGLIAFGGWLTVIGVGGCILSRNSDA